MFQEVSFFMDLVTILFWIIAIILVGSALLVVSMRNIVHSALALVVLFAMASGIYILLNAEFIAIVQILIYAGAVTILVLFALMLTRTNNLRTTTESNPNNKQWWLAAIISTLVGAGIILAVTLNQYSTLKIGIGIGYGTTQACALPPNNNNVVYIGQLLYSPTCYSYVLPFEIASLVLLVAIVGAIVIGRED
jgi:NADH:ubiquinone oxidoreductase subunit 6 (subunit J)